MSISAKAIVEEKGKIWLRRNEHGRWELPGGRVEEHEQPEQTVVREVQEELGMTTEVKKLLDACVWTKSFGSQRNIFLVTFLVCSNEEASVFETISEGGRAEFGLFTVGEALKLENLPDVYKRALRKYEDN